MNNISHIDIGNVVYSESTEDEELVEGGEAPRLVCVEYPGVVENPTRAIQTLGGLHNIAQVYAVYFMKAKILY